MSAKHSGAYAVALDLQRRLRFTRDAALGMRAAIVIGLLVNPLIFGFFSLLSRNMFAGKVIRYGAVIDGIILAVAAIVVGSRYRKEVKAETRPDVVQAPPGIGQTVREQIRVITSKLRSPKPAGLKIWLDRRNFHLSPTTVFTKEGPGIILPLGFVPLMSSKPDEAAAILAHGIGHLQQRDGGLWTFVKCYWDTCMRIVLPLTCAHLLLSLGIVALMTSGETEFVERPGIMESGEGQWRPVDRPERPLAVPAVPGVVHGPASQPATAPAIPATAPSPATQPSAQSTGAPDEATLAAAPDPATPAPTNEPAAPWVIAGPALTTGPAPAETADPGPAGAATNPATAPSNEEEEPYDAEEPVPLPFWTGMIATAVLCGLAPGMLLTYYIGLCTQRRNSEAVADLTAAATGNGRVLLHLLDPQADPGPPFSNRWPWLKTNPTNTWRHSRLKRAMSRINASGSETAQDAFSWVDTPGCRALERATSYAMRLGIGHTLFALFGLIFMAALFRLTKTSGESFPFGPAALLVLGALVPLAYVHVARAAQRFDLAAVRILAFISAGYLLAFLIAFGFALLTLPSKAPAFIPSVYFAALIVVPFAALAAWCAWRAIPAVQHVTERLRTKEQARSAKAGEAAEMVASDATK